MIRGNSFVGNAVMEKGGVVRHECSRSDLSSLNYDLLHEYYSESPTAEEKWLDWELLGFSFQNASQTVSLPSGDSLTFNPLLVEVSTNKFELNMRGSEGAVLKFERTPFFNLSDNAF